MSSGDSLGHIVLMDFDKEYNETTLGVAMKGPSPNEINLWKNKRHRLEMITYDTMYNSLIG